MTRDQGHSAGALTKPRVLEARLQEISQIENGWLEGKGSAPTKAGLKWLEEAWVRHASDATPAPFAYPTPEGNVQLEWTLDDWEISAEIDLRTHQAVLIAVQVQSHATTEDSADLGRDQGWQKLFHFIRNCHDTGDSAVAPDQSKLGAKRSSHKPGVPAHAQGSKPVVRL